MRAHHPTFLDSIAAGLRWLLEFFGIAAKALQAFEALFGEPARGLAERLRDGASVLDALRGLVIQFSTLAAPRHRLT